MSKSSEDCLGGFLLPGGENLRRSDDSKIFPHFVNTEHQLKSKYTNFDLLSKEYKIKTKNGTGAVTTAKNDIFFFIGLN